MVSVLSNGHCLASNCSKSKSALPVEVRRQVSRLHIAAFLYWCVSRYDKLLVYRAWFQPGFLAGSSLIAGVLPQEPPRLPAKKPITNDPT